MEENFGNSDLIRICFFVTDACGMMCPYCYGSYGGNKKFQFMDKGLALKVVKKLYEKYPKKEFSVYFVGGESTFNFKLIKAIIDFLDSKNVKYSGRIATHGVFSLDVWDFLIEHNISPQIGCDGPEYIQKIQKPVNKGVMGRFVEEDISFPQEIIERNIRKLVERNANFMVKSVITNNSVKKIPEIVEYFGKLGVKFLRIEPVSIKGRARNLECVNPEEFVDYFLRGLEVAKKYNMKILNWAYKGLNKPRDYLCEWIERKRFIVNPDRNVVFCVEESGIENPRTKIGYVDDEGNLIIDEEKFEKLKNIRVDDISCKNCKNRYICGNKCPLQNVNSQDFKIKCEITKFLLKKLVN